MCEKITLTVLFIFPETENRPLPVSKTELFAAAVKGYQHNIYCHK